MGQQGLPVRHTRQGMHQAAVAHEDPGRLHQPFAQVGVPGGEPAHQEQVHQQVQVAVDGFDVQAEVAGEQGAVQHPALVVGQHGPEPAQGFGRKPGTELGNVPLKVGADEILTPVQTVGIAPRQQTPREAAPQPQVVQG